MKNIQARSKTSGNTWSSLTGDNSGWKKLEKELKDLLGHTLKGLKELRSFLDAVERLVVTSLFVFTDEHMGANATRVNLIISAARMAAPLLVHFKRDDAAYFFPSLNNTEMLAFQLNKYIDNLQKICEKMAVRSVQTM